MTSKNTKIVYLDNASTTCLLPEVAAAIQQSLLENYGNPSSTHQLGRKAKTTLELCRRTVAQLMHCEPRQIVFTSSATEACNLAIHSLAKNGVQNFVGSRLEHSCVLRPLEALQKEEKHTIDWLDCDEKGNLDFEVLKQIAEQNQNLAVVLTNANNEIGNLYPINNWAKEIKSINPKTVFLVDMVQSIGHLPISFAESEVDFAFASAHKFHGPKGVGFLYARDPSQIKSQILGGGQERGNRSGTENLAGIVGLAKALELACQNLEKREAEIKDLKNYLKAEIQKHKSFIGFNGLSDKEESLFHILSLQMDADAMIAFQLDMQGIAVSQGSACQSGANQVSHVIKELYKNKQKGETLRISFSHQNTKQDIDKLLSALENILNNTKNSA